MNKKQDKIDLYYMTKLDMILEDMNETIKKIKQLRYKIQYE